MNPKNQNLSGPIQISHEWKFGPPYPPPPPPPAPPPTLGPQDQFSRPATKEQNINFGDAKPPIQKKPAPSDGRGDLFSAIRNQGGVKNLKHVSKDQEPKPKPAESNTMIDDMQKVLDMIAPRVQISDSESENDSDDSDSDWEALFCLCWIYMKQSK